MIMLQELLILMMKVENYKYLKSLNKKVNIQWKFKY